MNKDMVCALVIIAVLCMGVCMVVVYAVYAMVVQAHAEEDAMLGITWVRLPKDGYIDSYTLVWGAVAGLCALLAVVWVQYPWGMFMVCVGVLALAFAIMVVWVVGYAVHAASAWMYR